MNHTNTNNNTNKLFNNLKTSLNLYIKTDNKKEQFNYTKTHINIAVACSGGIDSMVLLNAMYSVINTIKEKEKEKENIFYNKTIIPISLYTFHIHHGISVYADDWANTVKQTAQAYNSECVVIKVSGLYNGIPDLENKARQARYQALSKLCETHAIDILLFAHHANDQVETILLNLLRGSGFTGLGMPSQRGVMNANQTTTHWIRPWLNISRQEIETYAQDHGLTWVEDPSNADESLRRNAIRHSLVPVIEAVEPRAVSSLLRFSQLAHQTASVERQLAYGCLKPFLCFKYADNNKIQTINGIDWFKLIKEYIDAHVQSVLLRTWLIDIGCKPPTQAHVYAMLKQLNAKTGDGLRCSHDNIQLIYKDKLLWTINQ